MKRCFRWLINWFTQWVGKMSWQEKVAFAIGGLLGIIMGIIVFVSIDKVPATSMDYQLLEQQAINVQQNPKLLLETNCNIDINDEVITIKFENDECKVYAKYNKNFEMLSYSKEDNHMSWVRAFLLALICGICAYAFWSFVLIILIYVLCFFIECISKNKTQEKNC